MIKNAAPRTMTDDELGRAYELDCAISSQMFVDGADASDVERRLDAIEVEMRRRGIL